MEKPEEKEKRIEKDVDKDTFAHPLPLHSKKQNTEESKIDMNKGYGLIENKSAPKFQQNANENEQKTTSQPPEQPINHASQSSEKIPEVPFNYKEPFWSSKPIHELSLEVIKEGTVIDTISISRKPYFVVGRLPLCDLMLEHPVSNKIKFCCF